MRKMCRDISVLLFYKDDKNCLFLGSFVVELSKILSQIRDDYFTEVRKMLLLLLLLQ